MDRYRKRLSEEMKERGETDRSLAKKVTDAGFPVSFTMINKTRSGNRQPNIDECNAVAWVFGYPTLDDFLEGPPTVRVVNAVARLNGALSLGMTMRAEVDRALHDLSVALDDPEAVRLMDKQNANWRTEYRDGIERDLRWVLEDQTRLWGLTFEKIRDIFSGQPGAAKSSDAAIREVVQAALNQRDPDLLAWIKQGIEHGEVNLDASTQ